MEPQVKAGIVTGTAQIIGAFVAGGFAIFGIWYSKFKKKKPAPVRDATNSGTTVATKKQKHLVKILFVDNDTTFKHIQILRTNGWRNTEIIDDIIDLNSDQVKKTDLFFVDINDVGKNFKDQGLGLVIALKEKYPEKKVVIYSAQTDGERFHHAFRIADDQLPKDADPYQFERAIETLVMGK